MACILPAVTAVREAEMRGLMQRQPLLVSSILTFAARHHGAGEVVSNAVNGGRHRYTYREAERRARRLARALERLGWRRHDRVGTLAWNSYRHVALYYTASGMGAVCHTINPRLFDEQVAYIVDHAEDRVLCVDPAFVPLVERVLPRLAHPPLAVVVTADRAHMPEVMLPAGIQLHCYEELLAEADEDFAWPVIDEDDACALCYTSGTTGHPKGQGERTRSAGDQRGHERVIPAGVLALAPQAGLQRAVRP